MLKWFTQNHLKRVIKYFFKLIMISYGAAIFMIFASYACSLIFKLDQLDAIYYGRVSSHIAYMVAFYTVLVAIYNREQDAKDRLYIFGTLMGLCLVVEVVLYAVDGEMIDLISFLQILAPFILVYGYKTLIRKHY